jgi:hypothetical protein
MPAQLTAEQQAKLVELTQLTARIRGLEDQLGYDPSHTRNPDGAYQARDRLFEALRAMQVPYNAIGDAAGMRGETVRATVNRQRGRARANGA